MESLLGVIVGGLIALIGTVGLQYLKGRQDSELDLLRLTDDRRIESRRIQRDTLLELQERSTEWINALIKIRLFIERAESGGESLICDPRRPSRP